MAGSRVRRIMRWVLFVYSITVLLMLVGGIVAFIHIFPAGWADQFWVDEVVTDPRSGRHAVIATYFHANSSTTLEGVWVVTGPAPEIGSTERLQGGAVAVWWKVSPARQISWSAAGRIVLTAARPIDLSAKLGYCYFFAPDGVTAAVCAKPDLVDVILVP